MRARTNSELGQLNGVYRHTHSTLENKIPLKPSPRRVGKYKAQTQGER